MPRSLKRFIETYRGSSFPTRCETQEGETWVMKMRGAGNGDESLLSEYLVNCIAAAAGLPVPDATIIEMPVGFPWDFGTDEFYDLVKRSSGPNLGLSWIDGVKPIAVADYNHLSSDLVSQLVTLDLTFSNWDRTALSGNLLIDAHRQRWIVDHGSCRAFFQPPSPVPANLPIGHILAGWEATFDSRWWCNLTSPQLERIVESVPDAWLANTQQTRAAISAVLALRLERSAR